MLLCTTFLLFSFSTCSSSFTAPSVFPHANYPRTADQNVTPVTKAHSTAEHSRATCSAQAALGIIKSLFAPNHGPLSFCPIYMFFVAFFLALRERSGRRQPPAERSPCTYIYIYVYTVAVPRLRFCLHLRTSFVLRFTDDRGLCSCVYARWHFLTRKRFVPSALLAHFPHVQREV